MSCEGWVYPCLPSSSYSAKCRKEKPTMVPERGQAPSLQELSSLEVEPLEVLVSPHEPESSLYALTATPGDLDVAALLTGTLALDGKGDGYCCCVSRCCCC